MTVEQLKAARALLGWGQKDLAAASGVSLPSIGRMEMNSGPLRGYERTISALREALEQAGVEFLASGTTSPDGGEGVRLRNARIAVLGEDSAR